MFNAGIPTNKSFGVSLDTDDLHPLVVSRASVEHALDVRPHPQHRPTEHEVRVASESD